MATLLENTTVVTMNSREQVLENQNLVIDEETIVHLGRPGAPHGFQITKRLDCSGKIVMPGLINAHSHLLEILQRSFRDNLRMETWREYRMLSEDLARLRPAQIKAAAALACAELLKSGVTAVVDHFSTRIGPDLETMRAVLDAFEQVGIRGALAPALRDQNSLAAAQSRRSEPKAKKRAAVPWREAFLHLLDHNTKSHSVATLLLGPSNPLNCSNRLLKQVAGIAEQRDLGVHTHFLETRLQRWLANRRYKTGLGKRLENLGFLSPRLSAAHCIWLDDSEIELMASHACSAVHNPASNLKLGSGIAPIMKFKKRGMNVALGTDGGDTSDTYSVFDQMRLAAFLSRLGAEDPDDWVTASDALEMGTVNGAQAVPDWRGRIGRIQKGYRADLVILKPHLRLYPLNNLVRQIVFSEGGHSVDGVIVNGEIVLSEGRLTRVDEDTLIRQVQPISKRMHRLYERIRRGGLETTSAIEKLYLKARKLKKPLDSIVS